MGSKVFIFLGLLLAIVLLISSEVAARDLAESSQEKVTEANGVDDAKYGGYPGGGYGGNRGGGNGGYPGGGNGGYPGGGYGHGGNGRGGNGGYPGRGGNGHGGYCPYGRCCGYHGRNCRCCSYAGEAKDMETQVKPHN